jgi:hypothetical protein
VGNSCQLFVIGGTLHDKFQSQVFWGKLTVHSEVNKTRH